MFIKFSRQFWLAITLSYAVFLLFFSVQPDVSVEKPSVVKQVVHNAAHIPAYTIFTLLLLKTFEIYETPGRIYLRSFLMAFLFGAMNEYFQGFSPGRTPSFGDMTLNAMGAIVAILIFKLAVKRLDKFCLFKGG